MKRDQPKGSLNKRYQSKVDLKGKETSRMRIFKKEYYAEGRFLWKELQSKTNLRMNREQPKGTLNKRYQPKVDLKGKETSRRGILNKEYFTEGRFLGKERRSKVNSQWIKIWMACKVWHTKGKLGIKKQMLWLVENTRKRLTEESPNKKGCIHLT